jgi:hypothetical protein
MINNERVPEKSDPNLTKFYVPTISKELLYGPSLLWKVCHSRISLSPQLMNTPQELLSQLADNAFSNKSAGG